MSFSNNYLGSITVICNFLFRFLKMAVIFYFHCAVTVGDCTMETNEKTKEHQYQYDYLMMASLVKSTNAAVAVSCSRDKFDVM